MGSVLDGIRILDFGRYIAGPFCGMLLADMGAEVIRIEKIDGS
ncbi:MAG TPA: CoA transferase, partial [Gammaproteobacteria bacterium]|nr:CoA transferase [Gammaproteobacteria bacterium]